MAEVSAEELLGAWPLWVVEVAGLFLTTFTASSAASLAAGFFETGACRGTDKNSNNRLKLEQYTGKCLACRAAGFFWLPTVAILEPIMQLYTGTHACRRPDYQLGVHVGPPGPLQILGPFELAARVFLEPLAAWLAPLAAWLLGSSSTSKPFKTRCQNVLYLNRMVSGTL